MHRLGCSSKSQLLLTIGKAQLYRITLSNGYCLIQEHEIQPGFKLLKTKTACMLHH